MNSFSFVSLVLVFIKGVTYTFVSLFSIVNPIGGSAIFLSVTKPFSSDDKKMLAIKVFKYGAILLTATYCFGSFLLGVFGVSMFALQIAGGLVIFSSAWSLLSSKENNSDIDINNQNPKSMAFFPLTMPLTAGAGAISVIIALSADNASVDNIPNVFVAGAGAIVGIWCLMLLTGICYNFSEKIFGILGKNGVIIVTRLTAFILISIGVGMVCGGIKTFVGTF